MMFFDKLRIRIEASKTTLCLGIDPVLPQGNLLQRGGVEDIKVIADMVSVLVAQAIAHDLPAVKFQSAYFEAFGSPGIQLLGESISKFKGTDVLVVLDAKRGDIASTMSAYGKSAFDAMNADCLTVNPYMGIDTIEPLLPWLKNGKGVYVVWVTSNKSAAALQFLPTTTNLSFFSHVHSIFSNFAAEQKIEGALGYVLGATKIGEPLVKQMLATLNPSAFLLPGVGAQGAVVDQAMRSLLEKHSASLVPVSREIGALLPTISNLKEYEQHVSDQIKLKKAELSFTN